MNENRMRQTDMQIICIGLGLVWFGLLGFYGISTFVGYLTPKSIFM